MNGLVRTVYALAFAARHSSLAKQKLAGSGNRVASFASPSLHRH